MKILTDDYMNELMYLYFNIVVYIYMVTPPPMIHPSLLVNCSSALLCLRMLSPKSINHRYLRGFLLFTYTDLCLLCSFSGICKPPKTQTRIWFCVRAETLEPFSVKTKETVVVFAQLVLFSVIRNPDCFITNNGWDSTSPYNLPIPQN